MSTNGNDPTWMPGIEMLRGIAALMVVVHHSWSLSNMRRFPGYEIVEGFGSYGVNIFFVLSAFLLSPWFWKPGWNLRDFWIRRGLRIFPAYAANVIILFLFFVPAAALLTTIGIRQVAANLTFTHYMWPTTASSFGANGALWTLTIEMVLYLMLPFMALLIGKSPLWGTVALMALGIGMRCWVGIAGDGLRTFYFGDNSAVPEGIQSLFIARQFIGYVPLFAVGIAARWVYEKHRQRIDAVRVPHGLVPLTVLLVPGTLMLFYVERASQFQHWVWFSTFDVLLAVVVVPAMWLAARPVAHRSFTDRAGEWLGARSYGIYLWHFPMILVFYERGSQLAAPDLSHWPLRVVCVLAATIAFASVSYTQIERPAQDVARRLTRRS